MVSLGIAGMGYIARIHLEAARKVSNAQVVAVSTSRRDEVQKAFPKLRVYSAFSELLDDGRIDAVLVCVPTFLHERYVTEAAERGRHILCEKPLAMDSVAAARMLEAARRGGGILMAAQVLRFWPQYVRIKEIVEAGTIGQVRSVVASRLGKYPAWGRGSWFRDPEKSGGCLLDLQVHDVDFVHWVCGHPRAVCTHGLRSPAGSWDHVFTTLTYDAAIATIEASFMMPEALPFTSTIRVDGTRGALEYVFRVAAGIQERDRATNRLTLYNSDGTTSEPQVSAEDPFVEQLRYFVSCVEKKEAPTRCLPEETLEVMKVMTASRRSADTGRMVRRLTD